MNSVVFLIRCLDDEMCNEVKVKETVSREAGEVYLEVD